LAVTLLFALALPAHGAPNTLSNAKASPPSGTTATTFIFTVDYEGAAASVTLSIADRTVPMTVISGTSSNGTFGGSTRLPVGSWQVTFRAVAQGRDHGLSGPTVTVTSTATPRPTTALTPTPPPTPIPTQAPPPITATPLAPTATPSPADVGVPDASGFIGGFIVTPPPTSTSTPDAAPALEGPGVGDEMWTLVTGGLIALSALAFLGMVGILRRRRPEPVDQPIGPAQGRPPTGDE
jgi:hypothetical protein